MTQNIYDNVDFFERYSQLPRSVEGLEGAPEWPTLRALLPNVGGLRVLDLGCGNMLLDLGFALARVEEWGPTPEQIAARPVWADERRRPPFLLVSARR
jgi:hypothetical protein